MEALLIEVGFGTIRNSTALKLALDDPDEDACFGTIRNSTALKHGNGRQASGSGFGTIRNSTALKPRGPIFVSKFRNRAIRPS